ncbi:hypothetical protein EH165_12080 [Nakamurella antarctica]|uniref:Uncharacterized protein n=1 Tax=Nakamurella antarctica TaxID=1902245 RepID=A0A3G8ZND1_9ACTN|nr:hypothetical protein [Nakamurella antarctica]AZI58760.1 hypothetical protein EH165_12080 [Nakamurella antarctica]
MTQQNARRHHALPWLPCAFGVVGLLTLVGAFASYRHSMAVNLFPAYLAAGDLTPITRYSPPWVAGAAGLLIVGGVLLMAAGVGFARHPRRPQPAAPTPSAAPNVSLDKL